MRRSNPNPPTERNKGASLCLLHGDRDSRGTIDDASLVVAVWGRETWASDAIWHRYAGLVHGLVARVFGASGEVEDVVQEIFLRTFAKLPTLRTPAALRGFIVAVTFRILKWELRKRRVRRLVCLSERGTLPEVAIPEVDAAARQALRSFYRVLDELPAGDRLVFVLRHVEGMNLSDIAAASRVSLATVKRWLVRASEHVNRRSAQDPELASFSKRLGAEHGA